MVQCTIAGGNDFLASVSIDSNSSTGNHFQEWPCRWLSLVVIMMLATVMVIVVVVMMVVILALVLMVGCLVVLTFRGAIIQSVPPTRSDSTKDKAVVDRIGIHPRTARFHSLPFGVWHVQ